MRAELSFNTTVKDRGFVFDCVGGKRTGFHAWFRFVGIYVDWFDRINWDDES